MLAHNAIDPDRDLLNQLNQPDVITRALKKGTWQALKRHQHLGNSIAVWRDGQVSWLTAEELAQELAQTTEMV